MKLLIFLGVLVIAATAGIISAHSNPKQNGVKLFSKRLHQHPQFKTTRKQAHKELTCEYQLS